MPIVLMNSQKHSKNNNNVLFQQEGHQSNCEQNLMKMIFIKMFKTNVEKINQNSKYGF